MGVNLLLTIYTEIKLVEFRIVGVSIKIIIRLSLWQQIYCFWSMHRIEIEFPLERFFLDWIKVSGSEYKAWKMIGRKLATYIV